MSDIEVIEIGNVSGPQGPPGPPGAPGTPGTGVPTGGTTGQVLGKTSNANYATSWQNVASGSGGAPSGPAGGSLTGTYPDPGLVSSAVVNLDVFTSSTKGVVPASGGAATDFLRADGIWTAPPSGGGGAPSGPASGSLAGTYPNPTIAAGAVGTNEIGTSTVTSGKLFNGSVTNIKTAAGADNTVKGTLSGAVADVTSAQLATLLGVGSGGGTTNFLRADGTWAAPPGGGGGGTAAGTTFSPVGTISSTNVQAAIAEVSGDISALPTLAIADTTGLPSTPRVPINTGGGVTTINVGNLVSFVSGGIGYATGVGGIAAQATNRQTPVTINKICGSITMVTGNGSATPDSFVVNNSTVAVGDIIILTSRAVTANTYSFYVKSVAAGSFVLGFHAVAGTASDQPIITFAVFKGVTA